MKLLKKIALLMIFIIAAAPISAEAEEIQAPDVKVI